MGAIILQETHVTHHQRENKQTKKAVRRTDGTHYNVDASQQFVGADFTTPFTRCVNDQRGFTTVVLPNDGDCFQPRRVFFFFFVPLSPFCYSVQATTR